MTPASRRGRRARLGWPRAAGLVSCILISVVATAAHADVTPPKRKATATSANPSAPFAVTNSVDVTSRIVYGPASTTGRPLQSISPANTLIGGVPCADNPTPPVGSAGVIPFQDCQPSVASVQYATGLDDGLPSSITTPTGNQISYTYAADPTDPTHLVVTATLPQVPTTEADSRTVVTTLDAAGRVLEVVNENSVATQWTYNPQGQVKTVTRNPSGSVSLTTTYTYGARGDLQTITPPGGAAGAITFEYTRYTLDAGNHPVSNPNVYEGRVTHIHYPSNSPSTAMTPTPTDEYFGYTAPDGSGPDAGELRWKLKRDGKLITLARDALHRVQSVVYPADHDVHIGLVVNGYTASISYDEFGRVTQATDAAGATSVYAYDTLDRLTSESQPFQTGAFNLTYSYTKDPALQRWTVGVTAQPPGGGPAYAYTYTYKGDAKGRIATITPPFGSQISQTFDLDGNRVSAKATASNGALIRQDQYYDNHDRPSITGYLGPAFNDYLADFFDPDGHSQGDVVGAHPLASQRLAADGFYDPFHRLYDEEITLQVGVPQTVDPLHVEGGLYYTYDANGNRLSKAAASGGPAWTTDTYGYSADNQLLWWNEGGTSAPVSGQTAPYGTYDYDANGRLWHRYVRYLAAPGTYAWHEDYYTWSSDDRLIEVDESDPTHALQQVFTAAYDADGLRKTKTQGWTGAKTTHDYGWGPDGVLYDGSQSTVYLPGMGQRQNGDPSTDRFYFTNDRGDVRFLAHWDGTATDDGVLTNAWGEKVGNGGTGWTPTAYVYRGALGYESEPGDNTKAGLTLDYLQQRYYDPTIGRFISPDPIGLAGGLNLYEYAGDDPLTNADPSGTLTGRQWRKLGRTAARIAIISLVTAAGASAGLAEGGVGAVPGAVQGAIYGSLLASRLLGDSPAEAIQQAAMNGAFAYVGGTLCEYGVNAYRGWKAGQAISGAATAAASDAATAGSSIVRGPVDIGNLQHYIWTSPSGTPYDLLLDPSLEGNTLTLQAAHIMPQDPTLTWAAARSQLGISGLRQLGRDIGDYFGADVIEIPGVLERTTGRGGGFGPGSFRVR